MSAPRGLTNFIRDIRNCASKEDETKRVNLELANIRTKFKQSDKLSSYDRKKCVQPQPTVRRCEREAPELCACSSSAGMSGSCCTSTCSATRSSSVTWRRVHVSRAQATAPQTPRTAVLKLCSAVWAQAVSLMSSTKYAEKQVGYMVTSVLLNEVRPGPAPAGRSWRG